MTRDEFIELRGLEDGTVILEPWDEFAGEIVGVTEDRCHVDYNTLGYMPNWDAEHRPVIINMLPELP